VPKTPFGVVELRRYVTHQVKRDALIALFEREFIETQEASGMLPFGHFRDLDDPNSFVWLRGFPRMEMRHDALEAFYTSQTWRDHREAANATIVDSDNVLLLRGARADSGFDTRGLSRPNGSNGVASTGRMVAASVFMLHRPAGEAFIGVFEDDVLPALRSTADRIAYLVTEERPNDFPRLPVREGEFAFVVAGICQGDAALDAWQRALDVRCLPDKMRSDIKTVESLRLDPAPRSLLR